ncbi:MAG: FHA domain-containing protein [Deltaproteobacteria bacterium]|nr:FHA domain-containing protein [Deltaproteobacteria bacterium]
MKIRRTLYLSGLVLLWLKGSVFALDPLIQLEASNLSVLFIIPFLLVGIFFLFLSRYQQNSKKQSQIGFVSITPHRTHKFYPLDEQIQNMEPVVKALMDPKTNVYSNLSKITLTVKENSVFLEEKNYKISILVNRRRTRRCFLYHGDILDMGELTLMFTSPVEKPLKTDIKVQKDNHIIPRARKTYGKILKNSPSLIPADNRKKTYYLTRNITFIGRSEMNDLTTKSRSASLRHSKIERVAGRFKITDLKSGSGTFVNGRRIETKFLKDGDIVAFESIKFTFSATGKPR